jgi:murein DD-endopeptidase MepM/ murein hydrolase activator NlpD
VQRSRVALAVTIVLVACGPPVVAAPGGAAAAPPDVAVDPEPEWSPPVDGRVVRGYEPPPRPYGPQHLGIDYAAPSGTPVRAAGDGVVAFAGLVGRSRAVSVDHAGARRTTYAYLSRVTVRPGTPVRRGDVLGRTGAPGPGHAATVLHFGYRRNGRAGDPALLFHPGQPRISLVPLDRPACPAQAPNRRFDRGPAPPSAPRRGR